MPVHAAKGNDNDIVGIRRAGEIRARGVVLRETTQLFQPAIVKPI
jgi:hypothetical protein